MICTWCKQEATEGGRLPMNAKGKQYWPACDAHKELLKQLKLDPMPVTEIESILKREAREAKK